MDFNMDETHSPDDKDMKIGLYSSTMLQAAIKQGNIRQDAFFVVQVGRSAVALPFQLPLPADFAKYYCRLMEENITLEAPSGRSWEAVIRAAWFPPRIGQGWKQFSVENGIREGCQLLFTLVGRTHFVVQFFDIYGKKHLSFPPPTASPASHGSEFVRHSHARGGAAISDVSPREHLSSRHEHGDAPSEKQEFQDWRTVFGIRKTEPSMSSMLEKQSLVNRMPRRASPPHCHGGLMQEQPADRDRNYEEASGIPGELLMNPRPVPCAEMPTSKPQSCTSASVTSYRKAEEVAIASDGSKVTDGPTAMECAGGLENEMKRVSYTRQAMIEGKNYLILDSDEEDETQPKPQEQGNAHEESKTSETWSKAEMGDGTVPAPSPNAEVDQQMEGETPAPTHEHGADIKPLQQESDVPLGSGGALSPAMRLLRQQGCTKLSQIVRVESNRRGRVSDEERERAVKAGERCALGLKNVSFLVVLGNAQVYHDFHLAVPLEFLRLTGTLLSTKMQVCLLDRNHKLWKVNWRGEANCPTQHFSCSGWAGFALDHSLEEGDVCVFELLDTDPSFLFLVHIFRVATIAESDIECLRRELRDGLAMSNIRGKQPPTEAHVQELGNDDTDKRPAINLETSPQRTPKQPHLHTWTKMFKPRLRGTARRGSSRGIHGHSDRELMKLAAGDAEVINARSSPSTLHEHFRA